MLKFGDKVFVYWNLHKNLFSVKNVKTGKVVAHMDQLFIEEAEFKVSEAGRQRVLKERRKNVHAGVQGYYVPMPPMFYDGVAKYNPYKGPYFVDAMRQFPLKGAMMVHMFSRKEITKVVPRIYYMGGERK